MERLIKSTVGVIGIGGVGAIAAEMLVRAGIGAIKFSDPDVYEDVNLNRQLFATRNTIGYNKAECASKRIKSINPNCKTFVFKSGITLSNVLEFCKGTDVLISQGDAPSSIILIHRIASRMGIPVVTGARSSLEHRWCVKATVWNYREKPDLERYDERHYPDIASVPFEELTDEGLTAYDKDQFARRNEIFKKIALHQPESFGSISTEDLKEKIDTSEIFFNRHVCSVIANTAGCLAATAALKLLLGGPETDIEVDLWNGTC